jgi:hypothetical protein
MSLNAWTAADEMEYRRWVHFANAVAAPVERPSHLRITHRGMGLIFALCFSLGFWSIPLGIWWT